MPDQVEPLAASPKNDTKKIFLLSVITKEMTTLSGAKMVSSGTIRRLLSGVLSEMMDSVLLRGQGLAVWYGERCLFERLDFELGTSQLALLVGANGSGKTTLLRVLAGITDPTHGAVTWNGVNTSDLSAEDRADVAYRGHHEALKKDLTLRENLDFHAALWGRVGVSSELLEQLKLDRVAGTRSRYLSAGQKRRASLAMLVLSRAKLWLLDEPTTNLDGDGRRVFGEWTRQHLAAGGLAVIATHQPEEFAVPGTLAIDLS